MTEFPDMYPGPFDGPIEDPAEDDDPVVKAIFDLRRSMAPAHRELWNAINLYAVTCGADPRRYWYGNESRINAVIRVERAVEALARAVINEP